MDKEIVIEKMKAYTELEPDEVVCKHIGNPVTVVRVRDILYKLGLILEEDEEDGMYIAMIKAGFLNLNNAYIAVSVKDDGIEMHSYAKEGIINQKTAVKALDKVGNEIRKYLTIDKR